MVEWGYNIRNNGRAVDLDCTDLTFARELLIAVPAISSCIACGACTATCTAGAMTDFNFRKLHTLVRRGELTNAAQEAHKCMLCGKCVLICPRGINTRHVIIALRRMLQRENS